MFDDIVFGTIPGGDDADRAEQSIPVVDEIDDELSTGRDRWDVDDADRLEQERSVPIGDDDYPSA